MFHSIKTCWIVCFIYMFQFKTYTRAMRSIDIFALPYKAKPITELHFFSLMAKVLLFLKINYHFVKQVKLQSNDRNSEL